MDVVKIVAIMAGLLGCAPEDPAELLNPTKAQVLASYDQSLATAKACEASYENLAKHRDGGLGELQLRSGEDPAVIESYTRRAQEHRRDVGEICGAARDTMAQFLRVARAYDPALGSLLSRGMFCLDRYHAFANLGSITVHSWGLEERLLSASKAEEAGKCLPAFFKAGQVLSRDTAAAQLSLRRVVDTNVSSDRACCDGASHVSPSDRDPPADIDHMEHVNNSV